MKYLSFKRSLIHGLMGFGVITLGCVQTSEAAMQVLPDVIYMPAGATTSDINVSNTGTSVDYVEAVINKVENPGLPNQKTITMPADESPFQVGLAITPNKMIIPPGATQTIRIMPFVRPSQSDIVYIIDVLPVSNALVSKEVMHVGSASASVAFQIGYGVRLILMPPNPHAHLIATRKQKELSIENTGNSNILLSNAKQCNAQKPPVCHAVDASVRIYAGQTWHEQLPIDGPISFVTNEAGAYGNFTVP
jgi:P pilus assembly chaperone PapD